MKKSLAVLVASGLWLAALPQLGTSADSCGPVEVLTDPAGDWDGIVTQLTGVAAGLPQQDLLGAKVSSPAPGKIQFVIQVASLPPTPVLTPDSAWFVSFYGPDEQTVYGVRMQTDNTGLPAFFSYVAAPANGGQIDGRFVDSQKDADPASNFTADGAITIIVNAADIGMGGGGTLSGFDGATINGVGAFGPDVLGLDVDDMPAGLARSDTTYKEGDCGDKSGLLGLGALQLPAVLVLAGLAALRRRFV